MADHPCTQEGRLARIEQQLDRGDEDRKDSREDRGKIYTALDDLRLGQARLETKMDGVCEAVQHKADKDEVTALRQKVESSNGSDRKIWWIIIAALLGGGGGGVALSDIFTKFIGG